jgi:hypothetical protein
MAVISQPAFRAISLPVDLADQAEELARQEGRPLSEILDGALRSYRRQQAEETLAEIREYAATRNPGGYTEADIPRLIQEVRAEADAERKSRMNG